ncbi:MAG: trypsin-like peptidase domain-containing protein [Candidatus Saccharibacteria bacterium]
MKETKSLSTSNSASLTPRATISVWVWLGVAVLALIAGGLGSYGISWWNAHHPSSSLAATQSKNIVVSEQNATIDIAKKVSPSVVSITSSVTQQDMFGRTTSGEAAGTGIIISSDGLILTNKHVVADGGNFSVITSDGKEYKNAKLLASDPTNDIAFLKIDASGLQPATLGDSSKVEVGSFVVAIGNALGQFQNTVTTGVISGKARPVTAGDGQGASERLTNLFQTDAAINPGNSGGPLVNIDGQVIGMNTAVAGQGSQGIGFAIPVNDIKADITSLQEKGKLVRAYLGVRYIPITASFAQENGLGVTYGAYIHGSGNTLAVISGSPAAKAGLKEGDIILKVNDIKIDENSSLSSAVNQFKVGDTVTLTVFRDGKEQQLKVQLAENPSN